MKNFMKRIWRKLTTHTFVYKEVLFENVSYTKKTVAEIDDKLNNE